MKKLLMLGTSKASCEMIEYAKSQGIYTIVTDYLAPEKSKAKLIADEYWMIVLALADNNSTANIARQRDMSKITK